MQAQSRCSLTSFGGLNIALTGASGAIGSPLYESLLARGAKVTRIGRRDPVRWDLREPLPDTARAVLVNADLVIHCAADTRIGAPAKLLQRVNTEAVHELVLALSEASSPPHLIHMSTAYVETFRQDGAHYNAYEASKWTSESIVESSGLGATIIRPSVIIGRRKDGTISRFSGVYIALRLLATGLLPIIPGNRNARLDIIPVDDVVDSVLETIADSGQRRRLIIVTSGDSAPTLEWLFGTVCEILEEDLSKPFQRPRFVTAESYHRLLRSFLLAELSPAQRVLLETLEIFLPYFDGDHVFAPTVQRDSEDIRRTWIRSVRFWAQQTGLSQSTGMAAWAPRNRH